MQHKWMVIVLRTNVKKQRTLSDRSFEKLSLGISSFDAKAERHSFCIDRPSEMVLDGCSSRMKVTLCVVIL